MAVKNIAASVLARLKKQAVSERIPFQLVLQLFAQEEFLRKLSLSQYSENLVLKGGMFIYTLTNFEARPTRDIDFLLKNLHASLENIANTMNEICAINTGNDFISIEVTGTEQISGQKAYPGVKTHFVGHINNVRIPFSIDIGIDDIIVPFPQKRLILTRLPGFQAPCVYTYSLESTIAEKLDAILQRMSGTSRMKDFYDIFYLSNVFDFDGHIIREAIEKTLGHRGRELHPNAFDEIRDFINDPYLNTMWKSFDVGQKAELSFSDALVRLDIFLRPVYDSIINGTEWYMTWSCEENKWSNI